MDPDEFCRHIEAYLCRKNDGHLIRIVGPSFDRVSGWAKRGIPPKVVFSGIDRYFERYYASGPRRRPVRIDFCEADVFDVYDEWRRAVGVQAAGARGDADEAAQPARARVSLAAHVERTIARLTALRGGGRLSEEVDAVLDRAVRELDVVRASARQARAHARAGLLAQLVSMDRDVLDALRRAQPADVMDALWNEAREELEPFRERMPSDAFDLAIERSIDRLIRERSGVPQIALP